MFRTREFVIVLILIFVLLTSGQDLLVDLSLGVTFHHLAIEMLIVLSSILAIIWLISDLRKQTQEIQTLKFELESKRVTNRQPSASVLETRKQLGKVINEQFSEWNLTLSEKEVGLFLLKGLSTREIAGIRNTLEKTVRQQASSLYKKAGVPGRHAFSAWFIEDFL